MKLHNDYLYPWGNAIPRNVLVLKLLTEMALEWARLGPNVEPFDYFEQF